MAAMFNTGIAIMKTLPPARRHAGRIAFATFALAAALFGSASTFAAAPASYLDKLRSAAQAGAGFSGFSADRGRAFFTSLHGNDWSCASCHGEVPNTAGKHARTGKVIRPLAPAANPERFADEAQTEKWFRRNCNDVLGRVCTAQEKGDVLVWLMSLKP